MKSATGTNSDSTHNELLKRFVTLNGDQTGLVILRMKYRLTGGRAALFSAMVVFVLFSIGCSAARYVPTASDMLDRQECRNGTLASCFRQCRRQHGESCFEVATAYDYGRKVRRSFRESNRYLARACELEYGRACYKFGRRMLEGWKRLKADPRGAIRLIKRGCRLNSAHACFYLGAAYRTGAGVKKDPAAAQRYFGKACRLGYRRACGPDPMRSRS